MPQLSPKRMPTTPGQRMLRVNKGSELQGTALIHQHTRDARLSPEVGSLAPWGPLCLRGTDLKVQGYAVYLFPEIGARVRVA